MSLFRNSYRNKLLAAFLVLIIFSLIVSYIFIRSIFSKDKESYLYETITYNSQILGQNLKSQISSFNYLSNIPTDDEKSSKVSEFLRSFDVVFYLEKEVDEAGGYNPKVTAINGNYSLKNEINLLVVEEAVLSEVVQIKKSREKNIIIISQYDKPNATFKVIGFYNPVLYQQLKVGHDHSNHLVSKEQIKNNKVELPGLSALKELVNSGSVNYGVKEVSENGEDYLLAYNGVGQSEFIVVSVITVNKAFEVFNVIDTKFQQILLAIVMLGYIFSTFITKNLTSSLTKLTTAIENYGKGKLNSRADIKGEDEFGRLAQVYNAMADGIKQLLKDLKEYNEKLEETVEERTRELKAAIDLQKLLMDSLGQGLMMFDKDGKILPVYSQKATDYFPGNLKKKRIWQHLATAFPEADSGELQEFIKELFSDMLPFDDMAALLPQMTSGENEVYLFFEYKDVTDDKGNVESVVVIITDKTQEIISMKEIEEEKNTSKFIIKLAKDRKRVASSVFEGKDALTYCQEQLDSGEYDKDEIQRIFHTLKGKFSLYNLGKLADIMNEMEDHVGEEGYDIDEDFTAAFEEIDDIINKFSDLMDLDISQFSQTFLDRYFERLKLLAPAAATVPSIDSFFSIETYIEDIQNLLNDIAPKLGKKIKPIVLENEHIWLKRDKFEKVIGELIHVYRNAIDHGIETTEFRKEIGKDLEGQISFRLKPEQNRMNIVIEDDGAGINWNKLTNKATLENVHYENKEDLIFMDGLSSRDEKTELSGMGVGMSAVKHQVLAVDGEITIDTNVGKGTTFTFSIPITNSDYV
jgi:two-component system chemotaxis sensor kinase CheA